MQDADARLLRSVREQHRLEKLLIAAMRMLWRRPGSVRTSCGKGATRAAPGNKYAGELDARDARRRDDVIGISRRETDATQLVGHAEPPEDSHRPGADLPTLHVRRVVRRA